MRRTVDLMPKKQLLNFWTDIRFWIWLQGQLILKLYKNVRRSVIVPLYILHTGHIGLSIIELFRPPTGR